MAISLLGNLVLAALLFWMRMDHERELRAVAEAAMRGDELHVQLHARSLAALEGTADVSATEDTLRKIITAGENNMAARRRAGLLR